MRYICTAMLFFKLGVRRFTDTSTKLDMKASYTVSIHKPNTYRYFHGNWRENMMGKQSFFPFQIEKPLVRSIFTVLGEKPC